MIYAKGPRLRSKLSSFYRRCRCYTCLAHPDHAAVLRRPTTTASSSGLLFNPAVTVAFYSTVICYGAMWDSRRKQDRRKSLDDAILEAELELSATRKRHASQLAALGVETEDVPDFASGTPSSQEQLQLKDEPAEEDFRRAPEHIRESSTRSQQQGSDAVQFDGYVQPPPDLSSSLRGLGKEVMELLFAKQTQISEHPLTKEPNSIYADESARATTNFTPKKLLTTEYSVARMASHLLRSVTPDGAPEKEELAQRALDLKKDLDLIASEDAMWTQSVSRLSYPQFTPDIDRAEELLEQLNRAITSLATTRFRCRISRRRFARLLAHTFLTSPVAPNKTTYTNLIKHLSRLREYGMVDIVLVCLDRSCVRYDELLIHVILTHYIRANQRGRFIHFHERMRGEHGGLMLAKLPHFTELNVPPPWKLALAQAGKYAAYVPLDAKIWEALITGYLAFDRRTKAIDLYEKMIAQGLTPGLRILTQLMRQALTASAHRSALGYWREAEKRYILSSSDRIVHGSAEHHCIKTALQLCKEARKPTMFRELYRKALERGLWMHALLPRVIPRHLASDTTYSAALTRQVRILKQRATMYAEDFVRFSLFSFASGMLLEGKSLAFIQNAFIRMSETAALEEWLRDRRAYGQHAQAWQLIKKVWRQFDDPNPMEPPMTTQRLTPAKKPIAAPQSTAAELETASEQHAWAKLLPEPASAPEQPSTVRVRRIWSQTETKPVVHDEVVVATA